MLSGYSSQWVPETAYSSPPLRPALCHRVVVIGYLRKRRHLHLPCIARHAHQLIQHGVFIMPLIALSSTYTRYTISDHQFQFVRWMSCYVALVAALLVYTNAARLIRFSYDTPRKPLCLWVSFETSTYQKRQPTQGFF